MTDSTALIVTSTVALVAACAADRRVTPDRVTLHEAMVWASRQPAGTVPAGTRQD